MHVLTRKLLVLCFVSNRRKVLDLVGQKAAVTQKWPQIVVLSDMLFDKAEEYDEEETPHQIMNRMVGDWHAKQKVKSSSSLDRPGITYWNLNPTRCVEGMAAGATDAGVCQLSGFAPGLLKLLRQQSHNTKEINTKEDSITTLRRILGSERYNAVRVAILGTVEAHPRFDPQVIGSAASVETSKSKRSNSVLRTTSDENLVATARIDAATGSSR